MNYQNALKQKVNMINELAKHDVTGRQQQYASSSGSAANQLRNQPNLSNSKQNTNTNS